MAHLRAIRGATTAINTPESILDNTTILLKEILRENIINIDQVISITFTCTNDLDAVYPAAAARAMGITQASLMCMAEMEVTENLRKSIRVQVLAEVNIPQSEVIHVYQKETRALRPDLIRD